MSWKIKDWLRKEPLKYTTEHIGHTFEYLYYYLDREEARFAAAAEIACFRYHHAPFLYLYLSIVYNVSF